MLKILNGFYLVSMVICCRLYSSSFHLHFHDIIHVRLLCSSLIPFRLLLALCVHLNLCSSCGWAMAQWKKLKDVILNTFHYMNKLLNLTMTIILYALWISSNQLTFPWMFPNKIGQIYLIQMRTKSDDLIAYPLKCRCWIKVPYIISILHNSISKSRYSLLNVQFIAIIKIIINSKLFKFNSIIFEETYRGIETQSIPLYIQAFFFYVLNA